MLTSAVLTALVAAIKQRAAGAAAEHLVKACESAATKLHGLLPDDEKKQAEAHARACRERCVSAPARASRRTASTCGRWDLASQGQAHAQTPVGQPRVLKTPRTRDRGARRRSLRIIDQHDDLAAVHRPVGGVSQLFDWNRMTLNAQEVPLYQMAWALARLVAGNHVAGRRPWRSGRDRPRPRPRVRLDRTEPRARRTAAIVFRSRRQPALAVSR